MSETADRALAQRIETLEAELESQRLRLRCLENLQQSASASWFLGKSSPGANEPSKSTTRDMARPSGPEPEIEESGEAGRFGLPEGLLGLRSWEWWLNKVGVGLLLFGVAFLFKFSVDQGWLLPGVRVGIGLSIGAVLVGIGLQVYGERRAFSQALLGGGTGAFYITGFAAFQLYGLVSYPVAVAFMVAVTLLAFVLALRQNEVSLALIAGLGGFGTPFVLYTESGSLGGLVLYTGLILVGVCAIYLYKGWRSLLLLSTIAVWTIFLVGYEEYIYHLAPGMSGDRIFLTSGVLLAWISLSGVSVAREILRSKYPNSWGFPEPGPFTKRLFANDEGLFMSRAITHILTAAGPYLSLVFATKIWAMNAESVGLSSMAGAVVCVLAAVALRRFAYGRQLSYTHGLVALALFTISLVFLLDGNALFLTLAIEASVLHLVSRKLSDRILAVPAHFLFIVVGIWLLERIIFGDSYGAFVAKEAVFFDVGAWIDLLAIAFASGISMFVVSGLAKRIYGILAHAAFLGVVWREFAAFPDSGAYISLAWGAYAVVLLVVGLRLGRPGFMRLGLVTLFVVVGKLFLVDLVWVGAVWRILLFLGFGGLFLILSYYLQGLWRPGKAGGRASSGAS